MADTLESLELEIKHSATGADAEITKVTTAIQKLSRALTTALPKLATFRDLMGGSGMTVNNGNVTQYVQTLDGVEKAASKAKKATNEAAKGVQEVAKSAKKANGPLSNFVSSLKRIAYYRLIRSILKAISQAFKEGLENAYEWSKATGGELAPALDRIASASQKMKNQMGAAFGELLITLEPLILAIIELVTQLAEAITWLIATVSGRDSYMVANDVAKSWKEADKAAGDYKRTILGFDVINRLNGPSGGSGSDSGGTFGNGGSGFSNIKLPDTKLFWLPFISGGNFALKVLQEVIDKVAELVGMSPVEIAVKLPNLSGWWKELTNGEVMAYDWAAKLQTALEKLGLVEPKGLEATGRAFEGIKLKFTEMLDTLRSNSAQPTLERESGAFEKLRKSVHERLTQINAKVAEQPGVIGRYVDGVKQKLEDLRRKSGESMNGAKANVLSFTTTGGVLSRWSQFVTDRIGQAMEISSRNVAGGMESAGSNIVEFVNTTNADTGKWAEGTGGIFSKWANAVHTMVADAMDASYANYKGFAEATGNTVPDWKSNRSTLRNVIAGVGITAGVIAAAYALKSSFSAQGGSFGNRFEDALGAGAYASGGFVPDGQLFLAREAGPELVGSIGGQTAVANNDQIVEAVSNGVFRAMSSVMSGNKGKTEVHVYLDSREIKTGQMRLARAGGV